MTAVVLHPLETIVKRGQCMGCGLCAATFRSHNKGVAVTMTFDSSTGTYRPEVSGWSELVEPGTFICPGAQMDMREVSQQVFGSQPDDPVTGMLLGVRAVCSSDQAERQRAASGGAIPAILRHLFEQKLIDAAYCVVSGAEPRDAGGRIIRNATELNLIHGSIYHPADFGRELAELLSEDYRFAIVGLPCQIAGFRMLSAKQPELRQRCVITISTFCGGINTFDGVSYYLEAFGIAGSEVAEIRYREGPWPGRISLRLAGESEYRSIPRIRGNSRWRIMRYMAAFQGGWMLKRCRICPDQLGDFADISVGDPHLPRFRHMCAEENGAGYSAMITRTTVAETLIAKMLELGLLREKPLSRDELVASQSYTLDNRRQANVYAQVDRLLGGIPPHLTVYEGIDRRTALRHYVCACLDLLKIVLPKTALIRRLLPYWQVFEYLFLRFPFLLIGNRLMKILRGR
jgi:coenzyme F420 hydrogenase subunit beta